MVLPNINFAALKPKPRKQHEAFFFFEDATQMDLNGTIIEQVHGKQSQYFS